MKNRAESVERRLTTAILRGEYAVGARLPTVRELAVQFEVNPSTVHRALKGLEATRLVTPRRGSGVVINDPNFVSDLSLMPAWIEALIDQPDKAAKLLEELLQVRRLVAADLSVKNREKIIKQASQFIALAEVAHAVPKDDIRSLRRADVAIMQFLRKTVGHTVGQLVMNILPQICERVPEVEEACYYWAQKNNSFFFDLFAAIQSISDEDLLRKKIEGILLEIDTVSVKRFEFLLGRRKKLNEPPTFQGF
jgi:DNA-binding FadR family transcriptional regulator